MLTAEPKEDEPVAIDGIVSGEGSALGGQQAGNGTGDAVTMARRTAINGVEGHHGTAPAPVAPPPPPTEDKSRPVQLIGGSAELPVPTRGRRRSD